jgi:LPS-assembly protein
VVYDARTGAVTATGNVQIVNADGTSEFAERITLDKDFTAGVALGFSSRQQNNIKLASAAAVRRNPDSLELNRAIFTPCDTCVQETGKKKKPTWSIRASKVTQDKKRRLIYYRNAVVQVFGAPVLFAPVFWHADPTAERQSGFLTPKIDYTKRRGATYEQPYLWVINPSADLVVAPQINTKVNPFLKGEYRQRFWSGQIAARFGVGHDQDFTSKGEKFGDESWRSYILGDGAFKPNKKWTLGFSAERTSDDLLFRRYDVGQVFQNRGLYLTDDQRLISQVYAVRQDQRSFLSAAAFSIQGLRVTDDDQAFPVVAPLIEYRYQPKAEVLGGRLRFSGGAVVLTREEDAGNPVTGRTRTPVLPGVDVARGSLDVEWRRAFTTGQGIRIEPFLNGRGDVYRVSDRVPADGPNGTFSRTQGTAGVDVSWPFIKPAKGYSIVLEPIVQVALSPENKGRRDIPNEDSLVFDFDETNLFQYNRAPGFDLYEGGQRVNVGGRATVTWQDGSEFRFIAGRSFRADQDPTLPARSSLRNTSSDWVTAASVSLGGNFSAFVRARLDDESYDIRRSELGVNLWTRPVKASIRYLMDETDISGVRREDFQMFAEAKLTKHWGVTSLASWDVENDVWTRQEFGVFYEDECTRVDVIYERDGTYDRSFTPSSRVSVRLTLATLGGAGYDDAADYR